MAVTADDAQAHRALNLGKPGKRYLGIGRSYLHASNRNALPGARILTETFTRINAPSSGHRAATVNLTTDDVS